MTLAVSIKMTGDAASLKAAAAEAEAAVTRVGATAEAAGTAIDKGLGQTGPVVNRTLSVVGAATDEAAGAAGRLSAQTQAAAQSMDAYGLSAFKTAQQLEAETQAAAAAARGQAEAVQRYRDSLDPLAAAHRKASGEIATLQGWLAKGLISSAEYDAGLARINKGLAEMGGAAEVSAGRVANARRTVIMNLADIGQVTAATGGHLGMTLAIMPDLIFGIKEWISALSAGKGATAATAEETAGLAGSLEDVATAQEMGSKAGAAATGQMRSMAAAALWVGGTLGVLALAWGATYLAAESYKESLEQVDRAMRSGNGALGKSRSELEALAKATAAAGDVSVREARAIEAALVKTGTLAAENFERVMAIAGGYAKMVGGDAVDATAELAKALADPAKAARALDAQFDILSAAQIQHIDLLAKSGQGQRAAGEVIDALTGKVKGFSTEVSTSTQFLNWWSSVFDKIGSAGAGPQTVAEKLEAAKARLEKLRRGGAAPPANDPAVPAAVDPYVQSEQRRTGETVAQAEAEVADLQAKFDAQQAKAEWGGISADRKSAIDSGVSLAGGRGKALADLRARRDALGESMTALTAGGPFRSQQVRDTYNNMADEYEAVGHAIATYRTETEKAEAAVQGQMGTVKMSIAQRAVENAMMAKRIELMGASKAPEEAEREIRAAGAAVMAQQAIARQQAIDSLTLEADAQERLAAAAGGGAAAMREAEIANALAAEAAQGGAARLGELEAQLRRVQAAQQEGAATKLLGDLTLQYEAAQRLADAQGQGAAAVAEANIANEKARLIAQGYSEDVAEVAAGILRLVEAEKQRGALKAMDQDMARTIEQLDTELRLVGATAEVRERELLLLDTKRKLQEAGVKDVEAELKARAAVLDQIAGKRAELTRAQESQREWERIWNRAAENIQDKLSGGFRKALDGGVTRFADFRDTVVDMMKDMGAEIAAALVFRPVVGSAVNGVMGALGYAPVIQGAGLGGLAGLGGGAFASGASIAAGGAGGAGAGYGGLAGQIGSSAASQGIQSTGLLAGVTRSVDVWAAGALGTGMPAMAGGLTMAQASALAAAGEGTLVVSGGQAALQLPSGTVVPVSAPASGGATLSQIGGAAGIGMLGSTLVGTLAPKIAFNGASPTLYSLGGGVAAGAGMAIGAGTGLGAALGLGSTAAGPIGAAVAWASYTIASGIMSAFGIGKKSNPEPPSVRGSWVPWGDQSSYYGVDGTLTAVNTSLPAWDQTRAFSGSLVGAAQSLANTLDVAINGPRAFGRIHMDNDKVFGYPSPDKGYDLKTEEGRQLYVLGNLREMAKAGALTGNDITMAALKNTKATKVAEYESDLAFAQATSLARKNLAGLTDALGDLRAAARIAATQGLPDLVKELERAQDLGFSQQWRQVQADGLRQTLRGVVPQDMSDSAKTIAQIKGTVDAVREINATLSLAMSEAEIVAVEAQAIGRLREGFVTAMRDKGDAIIDPVGQQLRALEAERARLVREASDVGAGLVEVERWYGAARAQILKESADQALQAETNAAQARAALDEDLAVRWLAAQGKELEANLLAFDQAWAKERAEVQAAGADIALLQRVREAERVSIIEEANRAMVESTRQAARTMRDYLDGLSTRADTGLTGQQRYQAAQAQFAAALIPGDGADPADAVAKATQAADMVLTLANELWGGTSQQGLIRDTTTSQLESLARRLGIPGFATGGDHGGGLRLVGERGPELEVTGPARIFNASETARILSAARAPVPAPASGAGGGDGLTRADVRDLMAAILAMRDEMRDLRQSGEESDRRLNALTGRIDRLLNRKAG